MIRSVLAFLIFLQPANNKKGAPAKPVASAKVNGGREAKSLKRVGSEDVEVTEHFACLLFVRCSSGILFQAFCKFVNIVSSY